MNLQSLLPKCTRFGVLAVSTLHKYFTASTQYNPNNFRINSYQFHPKQVHVWRNTYTFTQTYSLLNSKRRRNNIRTFLNKDRPTLCHLLFHYLLLNMFRMLVHPSSGACDLLWIYFMCCIAMVRCVLVLRCGSAGVVWCGILMQAEAWLGWGGVVSLCRLKQCFSLHKDTTPPQPNHTP